MILVDLQSEKFGAPHADLLADALVSELITAAGSA
jgi:hypothetical protein